MWYQLDSGEIMDLSAFACICIVEKEHQFKLEATFKYINGVVMSIGTFDSQEECESVLEDIASHLYEKKMIKLNLKEDSDG